MTSQTPTRPSTRAGRLAAALRAALIRRPALPEIADYRPELRDFPHTITLERCDVATARDQLYERDRMALVGRPTVVERHSGRLAKVCLIEGSADHWGAPVEDVARAIASTYGAVYVPAANIPRMVAR